MSASRLAPILIVLAFVMESRASAQSTCPERDRNVVVPVVFQFSRDASRLDWVYASLNPTLSSDREIFTPKSANVVDGALKLAFCVPEEAAARRLTARFGPTSLRIAPRPISQVTADRAAGDDSLRSGDRAAATVYFLNQPGPDWVIVQSIERVRPAAEPFSSVDIDVTLVNFGNVQPGASVKLNLDDRGTSCHHASGGIVVPVEISVARAHIQVASADPDFRDLVSRRVSLEVNPCSGGKRIAVELGRTGALRPGVTRIRYSIRARAVQNARPIQTLEPHWAELAKLFSAGADAVPLVAGYVPTLQVTGDRLYGKGSGR